MPVKSKGKSEYKTHYKWLESFRSKSFKPAPEQMAPAAGKNSVFSSISYEPALQHKRRVAGPPTSLLFNYQDPRPAWDDYALLGQHEKFAPNVCYKPKSAKAEKLAKWEADIAASKIAAAKDISPPKQRKMEEAQKGSAESSKLKRGETPTTPPPAPRKVKDAVEAGLKEGLPDKILSDVLQKDSNANNSEKPKVSQSKGQAAQSMNEYVQTNMEKGVALSGQEAPADYSLQYKAGVAPVRYSKKSSEYQKQFGWKKGFPSSPLLTAEQVVYNSNPQMSPPKKLGMPSHSEYQTQFQAWTIPKPVQLRPGEEQIRSKSIGGSAPVTCPDDPRLLQESKENVGKSAPPVAHGKLKRPVTEYRANFVPPTRYSYDQGAWKGAFPAQLLHSQLRDNVPESAAPQAKEQDEKPISNWFAEVLELRRRANEYKRRAQGTHFSREHLAQLLAEQTGYWDLDSACSSATLDALALESGLARMALPQRPKTYGEACENVAVDAVSHLAVRGDSPEPSELVTSARGRERQRRHKPGKKGHKTRSHETAWGEDKRESKVQEKQEVRQVAENMEKGDAAVEEEVVPDNIQDVQETGELQEPEYTMEDSCSSEIVEGRLSTPLLRQTNKKIMRHHLDLTTPSVGGVLLSSADKKNVLTSRSGDSYLTISDEHVSPKPNYGATKLITSPLLGKPTQDTHPLRDEETSIDHIMDTEYISNPVLPNSPPVKKRISESRPKKSRLVKPSMLSTVDERMGQTYKAPRIGDLPDVSQTADDDVLSMSAMSITSSSSLASQVYERARRRRDEFWGPQNGH